MEYSFEAAVPICLEHMQVLYAGERERNQPRGEDARMKSI